MKIRYRLVYNRSNHLDRMGRALVQIEARKGFAKKYFSTKVYVKPCEWDNGTVTANNPNAAELNAYLVSSMQKLESIEMDLWVHHVEPTLEHLKKGWKSGAKLTEFGEFARTVINMNGRKKNTRENLLGTVKKVNAFRPVAISGIDYTYLTGFEQWMREHGISGNTINKQMTNIRTIISEAIRQGLVKDDPFRMYQKPKIIPKEHITLTERELSRIGRVQQHENVRDAFLFCCRTGLRFSDYKALSDSNFRQHGSKKWLVVDTQKTGVTVRLPMHLIGDFPHPPIGCNSDVNRRLHEIVRLAKIDKPVTFHTARHTFATMMLNKGVDITSVQKMLGHTTVRMTQKYAETKDAKVERDIRKALKLKN